MPGRKHTFVNSYHYHIYHKTINGEALFTNDISRELLNTIWFYRPSRKLFKYSQYRNFSHEDQLRYRDLINDKTSHRVSVLAYCIMPSHFHLLLKQVQENGISNYVSQVQNSITRYFNVLKDRNGPIFSDRFKSKQILDEASLKHVFRYINLNPYSGNLVKDIVGLESYPWSSFREYVNQPVICDTGIMLEMLGGKDKCREFINDHREHQKTLEACKYIKLTSYPPPRWK